MLQASQETSLAPLIVGQIFVVVVEYLANGAMLNFSRRYGAAVAALMAIYCGSNVAQAALAYNHLLKGSEAFSIFHNLALAKAVVATFIMLSYVVCVCLQLRPAVFVALRDIQRRLRAHPVYDECTHDFRVE